MLVFSQDRDEMLNIDEICAFRQHYKGKVIAHNIYGRDIENKLHLLGTYDSEKEANKEIKLIKKSENKNKIHLMTIY